MRYLMVLCVFALQDPPQEVRIRSGPYLPHPPAITVQANFVELAATVHDSRGKLASGLQFGDFEVLDNGVPQTIKSFTEQVTASARISPAAAGTPAARPGAQSSQQTSEPRAIALFFDDTHAGNYSLQKSKQAAKNFVETGLQPGDRLGVFTESGTVTENFTSDTTALLSAIARIGPHPHIGLHGLASCPTLDPYQAYVINYRLDPPTELAAISEVCGCMPGLCEGPGRTAARDHVRSNAAAAWGQFRHESTDVMDVLGAIIKRLKEEPGNRILTMISPGFPTPEMESNKDAVFTAALRAHIVINTLNAEGLTAAQDVRAMTRRQQLLSGFLVDAAAATGGQYIHDSNDFTGNVRKLSDPPDIFYLLGFTPTAEPDNKYHRLKISLKNRSGLHVESRPGYFAALPPERPETIQERIDHVAASSEILAEIPVDVRISTGDDKGQKTIAVTMKVDASGLKFVSRDDRNVQQLTFVTLLKDMQGRLIAGKEATMDLSLTPERLADMRVNGIKATTSFPVPVGSYVVREIVREAVANQFAVSNHPVNVQ